ncbi:MAG TPA: MinD/ParA family protein [Thermosulfidibacter takaii]|uniref:MinD/ParA family protein n=1 Tax=Thermosulfidibacter takaii TaxID=412593 RepID=A0A7C0U752_9BACT|nr:MinD/ParA family protein [Thermosulfidibacter takaii]
MRGEALGATRTLAVTSGKGGMGKTNLVSNMAFILSQRGNRVLVLDADLGLANVHILMGLVPSKDLSHVIFGGVPLREVILEAPGGFSVLPASSGIMKMAHLPAGVMDDFLSSLKEVSKEYDYMILDIASGISSTAVTITLLADLILVLVGPDPTSFADAYAVVKILSRAADKTKKFGIVANFVGSEEQGVEIFKKFKMVTDRFLDVEVEYMGSILMDEKLRHSSMIQGLVVGEYPNSKASRSLYKLVKNLVDGLAWRRMLGDFPKGKNKAVK